MGLNHNEKSMGQGHLFQEYLIPTKKSGNYPQSEQYQIFVMSEIMRIKKAPGVIGACSKFSKIYPINTKV